MPTSRRRSGRTAKRVTSVAFGLVTLGVAATYAAAPDAYTWGSDGVTWGATDGWEVGAADGFEIGSTDGFEIGSTDGFEIG